MADNSNDNGGSSGVSGVSGASGASTADRAEAARDAMDAGRTAAEKTAETMVADAVSTLGNVCSVNTQALAQAVAATPVDVRAAVIDAVVDKLGPLQQAQFEQDLAAATFTEKFTQAPDMSPRAWEGFQAGFTGQLGAAGGMVGVEFGGPAGLSGTWDATVGVGPVSTSLRDGTVSVSAPLGGLFSGTYSHTPGLDGDVNRVGIAIGVDKGPAGAGFEVNVDVGPNEPATTLQGTWQDRDANGKIQAAGENVDNRRMTEFGPGVSSTVYDSTGRPTQYSTGVVANDPNNLDRAMRGLR